MPAELNPSEKRTTVRANSARRERIVNRRKKRIGKIINVVSWLSERRPVEAAQLAELVWSLPMRSKRPARENSWLETARCFDVPSGLGTLKAWRWGSGPTILLVHGWDGRGSQLGAMAEPLVKAGFQVVTFDSRGHGDSFGRRASITSFADAITALTRHVGPVHGIIAHSFGAAATSYAVRGGLPIKRVVFLGPVNAVHGPGRFARFMKMGSECTELFTTNAQERLRETYSILQGTSEAAHKEPPLLVYHDVDDLFVPANDAREIAATWKSSRYVETDGLGHHRILREEGVLKEIADFLGTGRWPTRANPLFEQPTAA